MLSHVFETLLEAGVEELIVVIGYEGELIAEHYGDSFRGATITYVDQAEQLGLAHAVLQARSVVDGTFVVLNGDNVFGASIRPAIDRVAGGAADAALLVEEVSRNEARRTGVVETDGIRVTSVVEKPEVPPTRLATTGCYVLPEAAFDACESLEPSDRGEYELSDAVDRLIREGYRVEAVPLVGWRQNVNSSEDIERVEARLGGTLPNAEDASDD